MSHERKPYLFTLLRGKIFNRPIEIAYVLCRYGKTNVLDVDL